MCVIGASLREPHTSVTALHTCASMHGPTNYHKFQMRAFKYFMKIDIVHKACEGQWGHEVGSTEVEACVAT